MDGKKRRLDVTTTMAAACPVCFGAADGPMIDASIAGMLTLIAVTLVVLCAIAGVALSIARRARAAAQPVVEL